VFFCLAELYSRIVGCVERLEVYAIKGLMKNGDSNTTILSIGHKAAAHELSRILCSRIERVNLLGKVFAWQIDPKCSFGAELVWISARKQFMRKFENSGCFVLPIVTFSLDLSRSIDDMKRRMSRRRRRDIEKLAARGYSYTVSRRSAKDFDLFYRKMYVPYVSIKFREAASIMTYLKSWSFYSRNGGIIFVKSGRKPESGILFQTKGKELNAVLMGICNYSPTLANARVAGQAALLFLIKWAKAQGFRKLNYGGTTPFLKDGIYIYKKEWGMAVENGFDNYYYALGINCPNERTLSFLQQNPFIFLDKGALKALVFATRKVTEAELPLIASEHSLQGLDLLLVASCDKSVADPRCPYTKHDVLGRDLSRPLSEMSIALKKQGFNFIVNELDKGHFKQSIRLPTLGEDSHDPSLRNRTSPLAHRNGR
jgi:hypothetical protein